MDLDRIKSGLKLAAMVFGLITISFSAGIVWCHWHP